MMKLLLMVFLLLVGYVDLVFAKEESIPRVIIALYNRDAEEDIKYSTIHKMAQMPLNHLGLKLEYYDINEPLPEIKDRKDVRGVISWFSPGTRMEDPAEYLKWASDVIDARKKYVVMGDPAFFEDAKGREVSENKINEFLKRLGLRYSEKWIKLTYDVEFVHKDVKIIEFERKLAGYKPSYHHMVKIDDLVTSHLVARKGGDKDLTDLIVTGRNGGYVATKYAFFSKEIDENTAVQWYLNPFEFFKRSFFTDDLPKPDTATIAGRRIYYSHIDGDGWNNLTQLEEYKKDPPISAKIIYDKVLKPYSDLPVTVAAIAGEIDKNWTANDESIEVAKQIYKLPNIEAATHTYSHPFFWEFFEDYSSGKERPFLDLYPSKTWRDNSIAEWFRENILGEGGDTDAVKKMIEEAKINYSVPRAYAVEKYDLSKEISGSVKEIEQYLPDNKKVEILMWSGNTSPYEDAVKLSRDIGIRNINGGDSRFDREYPSISWVSPVGRQVGNQRQIYASNSNENTYTDLWTGRFYGFKFLLNTVRNTETPIRLKPFNIYYHMYSGEKQSSLNALRSNLEYARTRRISPVTASKYAAIADGFYDINITELGRDKWKFQDRGDLQTIRFDNRIFSKVDLQNSIGVIGQLQYQGSLYVYLDENVKEPVIALADQDKYYDYPDSTRPYLLDSRWRVWDLKIGEGNFAFRSQGFGSGDMKWKVPQNGEYNIEINFAGQKKLIQSVAKDGILKVNLDDIAIDPVMIMVSLHV